MSEDGCRMSEDRCQRTALSRSSCFPLSSVIGHLTSVLRHLSSVIRLDEITEQAGGDRQFRQREPGACDVMHGGADALDLAGTRLDPGLDRGGPGEAVPHHL